MSLHEILLLTILYATMSLITGLAYGWDKLAAIRGWRRVPENRLHLLSLLCGWPGAWVAQQVFRHKSQKRSFRTVYWLTVILNLTGLSAVIYAMKFYGR